MATGLWEKVNLKQHSYKDVTFSLHEGGDLIRGGCLLDSDNILFYCSSRQLTKRHLKISILRSLYVTFTLQSPLLYGHPFCYEKVAI